MATGFLIVQLISVFVFSQGFECVTKRDCQDFQDCGFNNSGVYHVTPAGTCRGFDVYCDMITDRGGWLVFQRRLDGSVDFFKTWNDYELGFGNKTGEHWLGFYEMRVDLEDWEDNTRYAKYSVFRVEHTKDLYRLIVGGYSGDAGDSLAPHNGFAFTTKDKDNDINQPGNCAVLYNGAWWYQRCHQSNLNGLYLRGHHDSYADGVNWHKWKGVNYSLKMTEMKIRRI